MDIDCKRADSFSNEFSNKNPFITSLLCQTLGFWGAHLFYVERMTAGIIRLLLGMLGILLMCNDESFSFGILFFLVTLILTFLDIKKIITGNFYDVNNKKIFSTSKFYKLVNVVWFPLYSVLAISYLCVSLYGYDTSSNTTHITQIPPKDIPINERPFEALNKCKYENKECEDEYNKRLETAIQTIDSIYAEGNVREAIKLSPTFYKILQSDGSTISFEEIVPTKKGLEKRIDNLLPQKGCIQDSLQYANYLSTIYDVEKVLDINDEDLSKINKKYFSYLNRNCKLPHYDANVIITEERFVKAALNRKDISSIKANTLFGDIFKKIDENDFVMMKSINEGKSWKGLGVVEKKKNRTISYVEAPPQNFDSNMALMAAAFNIFSFQAYFPFKLHPSVENVEIGFNISELEYNWYAGYYHGIYAVTIKTTKKNLDTYYKRNNIKPPSKAGSDNAMSDADKAFFTTLPNYNSIKRWCSKNGFVCSKYLVERTK